VKARARPKAGEAKAFAGKDAEKETTVSLLTFPTRTVSSLPVLSSLRRTWLSGPSKRVREPTVKDWVAEERS